MRVPFVDLKAQHLGIKDEIDGAIAEVVSETAFIGGRYAAVFEKSFAEYLGSEHCVGVANGTDAIEIALAALGIGAGDEVIVPANTFFATAEAVSNVRATPVFVDNQVGSFNIDDSQIKAKITSKTKAIIAVHLYGLPAEMDAIMAIARDNGLKVLEDCAQAHGATYKGRKVGTFGDAASFSFYPSKNLGAYGDAGAIVTNDAETASRARMIANHGEASKSVHTIVGRNSRIDGIQAAVLSVKLPHLDTWLEARRAYAAKYSELLRHRLAVPDAPVYSKHTYHLYVVIVPDERQAIIDTLREAGIDTGVHYPTPVPFTDAYRHLGYQPGDFPCAYDLKDKLLSLPMFPELTGEMIEYVCENLLAALPRPKAATE